MIGYIFGVNPEGLRGVIDTCSFTNFVSNTFISNARLKLAKYQVKAKQHPEAEYLLFENICFHPCYHPKIIRDILRNEQKTSSFV